LLSGRRQSGSLNLFSKPKAHKEVDDATLERMGDTTIDYPTPDGATEFLEQWVGKTSPPNHEGCTSLSGRSRKRLS
jgi:hypothetical protein